MLSNMMRHINVQTRFMLDDGTWPPNKPIVLKPLLLIHHQRYRTPEEATAMTELHVGDITSVMRNQPANKYDKLDSYSKIHEKLDTNKVTKEIEELLAPLEKGEEGIFVLIEGAPGIGKSVLLNKIAYRWGKKELLQNYELVLLLCLRDPSLYEIRSINDIINLIYKGDKISPEVVNMCSSYLLKNGGKSIALLMDGYDEYPEYLQKHSLIADIIRRQVLPLCGLVVSSRPYASEHLHKQATIRVDILGITETDREYYIKLALPDQPHKIEELTQYLHQNPSIDSLCFIPFNMIILLYLYKLGISLPKNSIELYHHFIYSTISRHLSKFGSPLAHDITDLTDLPEPYNRIIQQLSKLSFEALSNNKLVFTLDELTAACPDIATIPGAISGFGLLQAVQHFGLYAKTMTLNFIHLTIQEFLAAHYIFRLSPTEELKVIKANFWRNCYFGMFSIYVSLTKGQRSSFKTFLSGGNELIAISDKFLKDQLKCLRLYPFFNEARDYRMCKAIEQANIFYSKEIRLSPTTLTASDLECVSLFLTSSFNKKWEVLDLLNCYIQDKGLNILYRGLRHGCDVTINHLQLDNNNLTRHSSSLISELAVKCKVKQLLINNNHTIGEDQQLYSMLTDPSNVLEELYMWNTRLSSRGARCLFTVLMDNNTLRVLKIEVNNITDDACDVITTALRRNTCLIILGMYGNRLSSEAVINIVRCLEVNNTLQLLGLPKYPQGIQKNVRSLQEVVNKKRESRGCQVKLVIKFDHVQ